MKIKKLIVSLVLLSLIQLNLYSQNVGIAAAIDINEIYLPFNNKGVIADVNVPPLGSTGQFAGGTFLFSSGFWLSGYSNDSLWANGVASASLVEDYIAGTVGMDPNDPKASIYKLTSSDVPFGQSWQDWIDAVDLGADFYDGNGDGIYNPVDLNGNNQWDPNEDKPDLILDETYWCVFNDGRPANERRWLDEPLGIEVRQTIFATSSTGGLGKVVFVRYRIKNTGTITDTLKDVYFSMWADADIGDGTDDVYACDTLRQGVYIYNNSTDAVYGNQVPSYMMDMLTGPHKYIPGVTFIDLNGNNIFENGIDTPLDTAVVHLGPKGIRIYPGAMNLSLSNSVFYMNNEPILRDPDNIFEVRNYTLGLDRLGNIPDPCTFAYGEVRGGVDCNLVNPYFWFSGDPIAGANGVGWICNQNRDVRGVGSVGPIALPENQEIEILIAYEIDRSTNPLAGIAAVRSVSDFVQYFYDDNFGYPIVSIEDEKPVASDFRLEQNYPNPFNPTTKIKFSIPVETRYIPSLLVTLKVFDILGNEIATLVNEEKPAGSYEVEFNSHSGLFGIRDLPSGIYFYKLQAGNFVGTKKMVLMK